MEWGARATRKSTRPASGTSEPCLHIPDTRYYKGVGGTMAVMGTFFLGPHQGEDNPIDDDPRWEPKGGARPRCTSLRHQPEGS